MDILGVKNISNMEKTFFYSCSQCKISLSKIDESFEEISELVAQVLLNIPALNISSI